MVTILSILALLPKLITATEELFGAFPGAGRIKKDAVLHSLGTFTNAATQLGSKIDSGQIMQLAGTLVDDYVAVQNATGAFLHNK